MKTPRLAITISALAITLIACSSGSQGVVDQQPPSTGAIDILEFTAPAIDGPDVVGQDYSGKDVAFWFWAPW